MQTTNNTILITGGGSGIGRGLAEAFHKLGNTVIIAGRREDVLRQTASANSGMDYITLDTSSLASIKKTAAEMKTRFPTLNVIINNAGVQRTLDFTQDLDPSDPSLDLEIDTNIKGVVRMTTAFLPQLMMQPKAAIVNVSSGLAFVPMARFPIYCATKAFVHSFTMSLRHQLRASNVEVIELAPPWVKTDLDAAHPANPSPGAPAAMPLVAFIEAAMQEFDSGDDELKVAQAKFIYAGGISDTLYETFGRMNG